MLYNIGYTNTALLYRQSTKITKVMLLYNTEWQYDHGMVVNYCGKKFYNIGPRREIMAKEQSCFCLISFGSMEMFHPVNGLVITRYRWLILISKIQLFLNLVKQHQKNYKILMISNLRYFFSIFSKSWVISKVGFFW